MKNVRKKRAHEPHCASVKIKRRPYFTHHNHHESVISAPTRFCLAFSTSLFKKLRTTTGSNAISCKLFNISEIKQIELFFMFLLQGFRCSPEYAPYPRKAQGIHKGGQFEEWKIHFLVKVFRAKLFSEPLGLFHKSLVLLVVVLNFSGAFKNDAISHGVVVSCAKKKAKLMCFLRWLQKIGVRRSPFGNNRPHERKWVFKRSRFTQRKKWLFIAFSHWKKLNFGGKRKTIYVGYFFHSAVLLGYKIRI